MSTNISDSIKGSYRWTAPVLVIALPVGGAFMISLGENRPNSWILLISGAGILLIGGLIQFFDQRSKFRGATEPRFRVAVKDALQPIVEDISTMPYLSKLQRESLLSKLAASCTAALVLLLHGVPRVRAVVFKLNNSRRSMSCMSYYGRGQTPKGFDASTPRGDRALDLVAAGKNIFVPNLDKQKPSEWEGSGEDYKTFISAAITASGNSFGMITVDAPRAGDLVDTDMQVVRLLADLLGIAFAEADRP
ncbi:GAF domain-containing protein [Amycolatopsis cynarae]|uniref:GAF domain-containing protein n=1 Tax=Amycolatopsis cynarae TaxID=2995223 RepID=A0ABY7B4T7_9PSEU|nr:GAF domain-containing protein [Amycolatopsis sp. HUAS 11-8]WAL65911.1 GAF domain-containing protein [Amycolatopsis sp. HUAS 11-8]